MRNDQYGTGIGNVSITSGEQSITVGRRYAIEITYVVGPKCIEVGGCLRFKLPGFILGKDDLGSCVCSNPDVKWSCSNHLPKVNGKNGKEFFTIDYLFFTIEEARLNEDDTLTVKYGNRIALFGTAAPTEAHRWAVEVSIDYDGNRIAPSSGFYLVRNPPVLNFVCDKAYRMEVFVPSYTCVDECFRTTIRLMDKYNNLVEDYTGTVILDVQTDEGNIVLGEYKFTPQNKGVLAIEDTKLRLPGVYRIIARDEAMAIYARSNPTKMTQDKSGNQLFWGDTHCHSMISADTSANNELIARPADDYDYARNRSALDFCMVTDHIEDQSGKDWDEIRKAAKDANEPHRFVTFSAFEATYPPLRSEGDKNVYFLDDDEALVSQGTTEELYENLKQRKSKAMVIPHLHVPTNWERHDPEVERVVEIYAHWGCGLSQDTDLPILGDARRADSYVQHALEQGAKLGFIASADHSHGHPGDDFWWRNSNYNGGLAAISSPELTRPGIWENLWNRHCYATTRARILLEFEVNGRMMGEEFDTNEDTRELRINVHGTTVIDSIEIVKNGRVVKKFSGDKQLDMELTYSDDVSERETDYYYIHVTQEDSEQAWSSPVWVKSQGKN